MRNIRSLIVLFICCAIFAGSPSLTKRWNNAGPAAVISWDIFGYWFYLPSYFYDDLGKLNNYDYIQNTYHPGGDAKDNAFIQPETGRYVMNYSCGQAIMDLPAFAAGHIWAKSAGYKTDGFTLPYQMSLIYWCVCVSCLGLWLLRKLLLRYFDDWLIAIVLLTLCLATNYYNFVAFSPMTHAFLLTLYAAILLLTDSFYRADKPKIGYVILIGLLSGLATITRPTEIICVFIPLLWGVSSMDGWKKRLRFFWDNKQVPIAYAIAAFVAALPQLLYWKYYAGHWLFFSYHGDDKTFSFLTPHVLEVLFSYKKGWFTYTPVMLLSIIGFYQLYRNYRQIFWSITVFTVINLYLVSAWDCWWYGGSFSMRALIQSYALLMFPMAAFLDDMLRRRVWKYLIATILLFCIWLNLLMTWQTNASLKYGGIEGDGMTAAYYWRIFGKTNITLKDKKLMDDSDEMPVKFESSLKEVYRIDMDKPHTDPVIVFADRKCFKLDGDKQRTEKFVVPVSNAIHKGWYRAYADVFYPDKELNMWKQTEFTMGFYKGEHPIRQKMIRPQRITEAGAWQEVYVDIKVPGKEYDSVAVYLWNTTGQKAIYMTNIRVVYTDQD